ncbi:hypothetical protein BU26DRAFT_144932 [Trematosphaeria pertusa]|uniref:Uncharacterized protein n=1 Tax=Trematosphaeria pertusa TaxID=390896 RepID=A0A6A6IWM6_9PLEO|nr:uncharacterized protein BU26DRAFT_144932 [Trematosphaeria pertusa]KAF2254766.1 hypothetical protein BU26DRAFT_144932 [Trematosphaeria pertusa]
MEASPPTQQQPLPVTTFQLHHFAGPPPPPTLALNTHLSACLESLAAKIKQRASQPSPKLESFSRSEAQRFRIRKAAQNNSLAQPAYTGHDFVDSSVNHGSLQGLPPRCGGQRNEAREGQCSARVQEEDARHRPGREAHAGAAYESARGSEEGDSRGQGGHRRQADQAAQSQTEPLRQRTKVLRRSSEVPS